MTSPPLRWVAVFAVLPLRGYLCVRVRAERPLAFRRPAQSDGAVPAPPSPTLTHIYMTYHVSSRHIHQPRLRLYVNASVSDGNDASAVSLACGRWLSHLCNFCVRQVTLFRMCTLEDWTDVMYIAMEG